MPTYNSKRSKVSAIDHIDKDTYKSKIGEPTKHTTSEASTEGLAKAGEAIDKKIADNKAEKKAKIEEASTPKKKPKLQAKFSKPKGDGAIGGLSAIRGLS